jgi:hypothetical protein
MVQYRNPGPVRVLHREQLVSRMVSPQQQLVHAGSVRRWDRLAMTDDISIAELQKAVEHMHGVPARFVEAVEVDERHEGRPVWQGAVKVFELTGHPSGAKRAYAWSYATTGKKRRFIAILGLSPVDDAIMAVRTAVLAQVRETERAQN